MSREDLIQQIKHAKKQNATLPAIGMYNQTKVTQPAKQPYIQHSFVDWRDPHYLAYVLAQTQQNANTALITIEPKGEPNGAKLLSDIQNGKHDRKLNEIAKILKASPNPVYIRFAHEMELQNLYAWGNQDPQLFVSAYKHTIDIIRKRAPSTQFVWAPAGNTGADAYYPGDDYVDIIGTTMLFDQYWYGNLTPTFNDIQAVRSWMLSYNKPVWIVEFGAGKANQAQQQIVIDDALKSYKTYGYDSLIYLNMKDANIEGPDYRLSDINNFADLFNPPKPKPAPVKKTKSPSAPTLQPEKQYPESTQKNSCSSANLWKIELETNPLHSFRSVTKC